MDELKMKTEYLFPVGIVSSDKLSGGEHLLCESTLQVGLGERNLAIIEKGGHILLDFGREVCGSVRIIATAANCKIRLRLGESVGEACSEIGEKGACNDHATRDDAFYLAMLSDTEHFNSAFRYLRIDAIEDKIALKSVTAKFVHTALESVGYFESENELANKIFSTAAYTVSLCKQNGSIWDGVKRDRLVWIGDLYPELLAVTDLYDNADCIVNAIDFTREMTPLPNWMCNMPTYSLWWIICLGEYVFRTGDEAAYYRHRDYLVELIKQYSGYVSEDGCVLTNLFLDWQSKTVTGEATEERYREWAKSGEMPDVACGVNAICVMAMQHAKRLFEIDGTDCSVADDIYRRLRNFRYKAKTVKSAKAIAYLAGCGGDPSELLEGGAKELSTFTSWATLIAAHDADEKRAAEICLEYYGGMLDMGATTFWEDFNIEWLKNAAPITRLPQGDEESIHGDRGAYCYLGYRHSLCHGWSAGVIEYFFSCVLGVKRVSRDEITVSPNPVFGNMKGRVALGNGKTVTVEVRDGKTLVTASEGVRWRVL